MAEKKMSLGKYQFSSYSEFRDAQEDIEKIDIIKREIDLSNPEAALRLYAMIRDREITFKTEVGRDFFLHISDVVADRSGDILAEQTDVEKVEKTFRFQRHLGRVLICVAAAAFCYVGFVEIRDYMYTNKLKKLQSQVAAMGANPNEDLFAAANGTLKKPQPGSSSYEADGTYSGYPENSDIQISDLYPVAPGDIEIPDKEPEPYIIDRSSLTVLPEYADLYEANRDLAGWITIPDTDINYPVMQTLLEDDFYLDHDFYGAKDSNGTIFVDSRCDIVNQPSNTILYGHNMRSGMMFGSLKKYQKRSYFDAHKIIYFNTIYERRTYQVVAVCLSEVSFQDETGFRYYNYIDGSSEGDFDEFYNNICELNVIDDIVDLTKDDNVLTLSTCNNYTQDGRLFIVAKRVQ